MIDKLDVYLQYLRDITNHSNYNIPKIKECIIEFKESLSGDMTFNRIEDVSSHVSGLYNTTDRNFISLYDMNRKEKILSFIYRLKEGYIPCIVPEFSFKLIDTSEKDDVISDRYQKYLESSLVEIFLTNKTTYDAKVKVVTPERGSDLYTISMYITDTSFRFRDVSDLTNLEHHILQYNNTLSKVYSFLGQDRTNKLIDDNPYLTKGFRGEGRLKYDRHHKKKNNPERSRMEEENTMYVFISRPKFVESEDGKYIKDIEIENMVPIDPYDVDDLTSVNMLQLRARSQGIDSQVNCIWLPKDAYEEGELDNINEEDYLYLRQLIDKHKERL